MFNDKNETSAHMHSKCYNTWYVYVSVCNAHTTAYDEANINTTARKAIITVIFLKRLPAQLQTRPWIPNPVCMRMAIALNLVSVIHYTLCMRWKHKN